MESNQNNIQIDTVINTAPEPTGAQIETNTSDFVPTKPLNQPGEPTQTSQAKDSLVQDIATPAQTQLPADTYLYANTSDLGGVIQYTAQQYNLDPAKLEALVNTIRNKKANLSGFYDMQIGYFPGMSAESLVASIGRVADLANTVSDKKRLEAQARGEEFTSDGIDELIDSLQSINGEHEGKFYYQEALTAIQEADHIQFDTPVLAEYYETLVRSGVDKATAWTRTMHKQDEYRKVQDTRAVYQDFQNLVTPSDMQQYVSKLHDQVQNATDAETKLRLYTQYEAASKLSKSYTAAFEKDPATYLISKDPTVASIWTEAHKSGDFSNVVTALDARYDEMGIPHSKRKYLSEDQADTIAKEVITYLGTDPIKAQSAITNLYQQYGSGANKVITQLITHNKLPADAKLLIEGLKTGSPKTNEAVLDMLKHKQAYGVKFNQTMLNAPNASSADTLRHALEVELNKLKGIETLTRQFDITGNVLGKQEFLQSLGDMAVYYKYKYPNLSDKDIAKRVQDDFINSTYSFDADGRAILQQRTLDGKPILYNGYTAEQAKNYLSIRKYTGQNLRIGALSIKNSERLLQNHRNIKYITKDQFIVQPVYDDGHGTIQAIFKTDKNGDILRDANGQPIPFTLNLKYIGEEGLIGISEAKENARKLYKTLVNIVNISSTSASTSARTGATVDPNSAAAMKTLQDFGFDIKHFDMSKPFSEQFNRTKLSPRRIQALSTLLKKNIEFEQELKIYEKLKRQQREDVLHNRNNFLKHAFIASVGLTFPVKTVGAKITEAGLNKLPEYNPELQHSRFPELKAQRIKLQKIEQEILQEAAIYLNYKGKLQSKPFTDAINRHNLLDKILWGGYGY